VYYIFMRTFILVIFFLLTSYADEPKKIKVGVYDNPPKIYVDSQNKSSGFFVDLVDHIAKKEQWEITYVPCEWNECLEMLQKGEIDIMPDVAYSQERSQQFRFNKEIVLSTWSTVYTQKKTSISSILDLDGKKIAMLQGSIQQQQVQESFSLFEIKPTVILTQNFDESFKMVQDGKADAAIVNRYYGALNKDRFSVKESSILLNPAALKFAFSPNTPNQTLIDAIDKNLKELKANKNSIYYRLIDEHLSVPEPFNIPFWLKIAFITSLSIIVILLIAIFFFRYLLSLKTAKIIESAEKFKQLEEEKIQDYRTILYALISMIEQRDSYTAGHSERVAKYSILIAREMGYSDQACELLFKAATLHDIGKIATPDAVLLKPDKLTKLEYELIKEHVNTGVKILKDIPMFSEMAHIIQYHHEKYDGSGYPFGIAKDEIPPLSRIMMVADAYDAMTTNRIYKHKKSIPEALEELSKLSAIHYHPEVITAALKVLNSIEIEENIAQTPITAIEEQRFVYFYKDAVTDLYNVKYLEIVLEASHDHAEYTTLCIISLHQFDLYNQQHSWEGGNEMLKSLATLLSTLFPDSLIFRIRANNFIILHKKTLPCETERSLITQFIESNGVVFDLKTYDIERENIYSYRDLKPFL